MQRQRSTAYFFSDDVPTQAINDQPVSPIDPLQPIDTPLTDTQRKVESLIEDASLHITKLDDLLFENGDRNEMLREAKAIASCGKRVVDALK